MRKKDWIGRRVRLLQTICTVGGDIFKKGSIMMVIDNYKGLHLRSRFKTRAGMLRVVTRVQESKVKLLAAKGVKG